MTVRFEAIELLDPIKDRMDAVEAFFNQNTTGPRLTAEAREKLLQALVRHRAETVGVDRMDANDTAVLQNMLEHRTGRILEIQRPEYKARKLVPTKDTVPWGATTGYYEQWDRAGMAKLIANYGDDVAMVGVEAKKVPFEFREYALGYELTIQDLEAAAFANVPLPTKKAAAMEEGFERRFEQCAAVGDSEAGTTGLLNHPNVPVLNAAAPASGSTTTWLASSHKTAEEVLADLETLWATPRLTTKGIESIDTIVLPLNRLMYLQNTPVEAGTGGDRRSIMREFKERHADVQFTDWHFTETASSARGPVAMGYLRSERALSIEAKAPKSQPPQAKNFATQWISRARYGAVEFQLPLSAVIMEGI